MKKTFALIACTATGALLAASAHAAALNPGDRLTIDTGNAVFDGDGNVADVSVGSWFGVDANGNLSLEGREKTALAQGTTGIVVGQISVPGANHSGEPLPGDSNAVTAPSWFFGNTGSWFFASAPGGSVEAGFDMSGWSFGWASVPRIPLGSGAWQPGNCAELGVCGHTFENGIGWFRWSGVYGAPYTLDFTSTVPNGDPSGTGGTQWYTHLEGRVLPVPEPAPGWLFAGAIPLVAILARRRRVAG